MGKARERISQIGMKDAYLSEALYHLRRNGWIVPLHRGLYAISSSMPGVAPIHEFEIAMALAEPAAISHGSAFHYHGLSDQPSHTVFILTTTKTSVPRRPKSMGTPTPSGYPIGGTTYQFIQVKPERFFGIQKVWVGESRITVTDPERTLLDGLSMPQLCGDFSEVLHAFEIRHAQLDLSRLMDYALKLDSATVRRLGWILEKQGIPLERLQPLSSPPMKGYRKLDPTGPQKGPLNKRWMIQENIPGKITS